MTRVIDTFIAPHCDANIEILYEDEHLLLINKPSGLLSLSGKHPQNIDSVHYRLRQRYPDCALAHRLDFGTSGVMVVAKNKVVNAALCLQFSQRSVTKGYQALLCGHLPHNQGTIDAPIAKYPANFPRMTICTVKGKAARSHYQVIDRSRYHSQLLVTRVNLVTETGRTHQLRLHCQHMGYPILGCDLYGGMIPLGSEQSPRLMLHASNLMVIHPISQQRIDIHSAPPF